MQSASSWIRVRDGCRLAARVWRPDDGHAEPLPAILEYIPYRKNHGTAARDAQIHPYFAAHGYVSVRVDMRGSGDSEGLLLDEYLSQEQDDGVDVIAWLAEQPWCSGRIGMIGKSWGGFNGLQIAARRPSALGAVITVCSTDDRYADDVHYRGGCVLASDMLSWAATMLAGNARPPDPAAVGESWRARWHERMQRTPPYIDAWLAHQRRDAYWRHGSVCEDFAAIDCPVYAVGGWADGYSDAVGRLLAGLSSPRKGLIGPWAHSYAHEAEPGPRIGFLQECVRWFDHWLKDLDTGIMDEPMLRAWVQGPRESGRGGRWVAEPVWPSTDIQPRRLALSDGTLVDDAGNGAAANGGAGPDGAAASSGADARLRIAGVQSCGADAGAFFSFGQRAHLPGDQRRDDGLSLCFTSAPLERPLEILGAPEAVLEISVDRPAALLCARLCDVSPDGHSRLVTRGLLNLAHLGGHDDPSPLRSGVPYTVRLRLGMIGHTFGEGHRVRLAVSPTYWPWAWPSPAPVTITVHAAGSGLQLPERPARPEDLTLAPFEAAEMSSSAEIVDVRPGTQHREVRRDLADGAHQIVVDHDDYERLQLADGLAYGAGARDTFTIRDDDPLSARVDCERTFTLRRGEWQVRIETASAMTADAETFHLEDTLRGYETDELVFERVWRRQVARDHV